MEIGDDSASETQDDIDMLLSLENEGNSEEEDVFSELDNFFEEQGQTGDKVSDKLASDVNRSLRNPVDDNKLKELKNNYKQPENAENLQVPTTDHFIWQQLPRDVRSNDVQLQKAIGQMAQSMVPLIQALDHIQSNKVLDRNILKTLTGDPFKLMAHSIASNNKTRKDKILNALMPKYKIIASKSTPSATNLCGDNIKEEIKSLNEKTTTIATTSRISFLQWRGWGVTTISAIRTSPEVAPHSRGITTDLGNGKTRGSGNPTKEAWGKTATKSDSTGCKFSLLTVCFQYNRKLRGWENQVSFK